MQGAGKTTTTAKLANYIKTKLKKDILLTSVDTQRPAASEQLKILAESVAVEYFRGDGKKPVGLAKQALKMAKKKSKEVLLVDTAGRQVVDAELMAEVKAIAKAISPTQTLFVLDAMTGQDAINSAKIFHQQLSLTGTIFSKMDSDTRGGAIFSVKAITQLPILFTGSGEKIKDLEPFYPDRVADSILGMGDIFGLIEKAQSSVDTEIANKALNRVKFGNKFNFNDFIEQLNQLDNMGGVDAIMDKMPGLSKAASVLDQSTISVQQKKYKAIIGSMTNKERQNPDLINSSRKRRIISGSGCQIQDFGRMMKQFKNIAKLGKRMSGGGMRKMMNKLSVAMSGGDGGLPSTSPDAIMEQFKQFEK